MSVVWFAEKCPHKGCTYWEYGARPAAAPARVSCGKHREKLLTWQGSAEPDAWLQLQKWGVSVGVRPAVPAQPDGSPIRPGASGT